MILYDIYITWWNVCIPVIRYVWSHDATCHWRCQTYHTLLYVTLFDVGHSVEMPVQHLHHFFVLVCYMLHGGDVRFSSLFYV